MKILEVTAWFRQCPPWHFSAAGLKPRNLASDPMTFALGAEAAEQVDLERRCCGELLWYPTILWAGCGRGTGRPYLAANSDFLYLGSLR